MCEEIKVICVTFSRQTCDLQIESLTQTVTMRKHHAHRGENHRLSESSVISTE